MKKTKKKNTSYSLEMFKAIIIALIISLVLILIFAAIIVSTNIPTTTMPIIIQIIKGISILAAAIIVFRLPKNGWIRGIIFGILYTMITFVVFSLMDSEGFRFTLSLLNDIAFGAITGLVCGIICVNLRKSKHEVI
ncbi:MAG: TIGR04086 family membrane protein [Firmicutes bacterium]|nr:TIGR04086 family membrane protein [Bacillota bacterium]